MEDLKEMFAQMKKLQMVSQQKNEEKLFNFRRKRRKNLKKRGKTTTFLPWIAKQQEARFKSLSNNQPTDSKTIFTQNTVWNALETFSYVPDEDKTAESYYRRYLYYRL